MIAGDWISVAAVLFSPLIALQISRRLEESKEVKHRKMGVFYTLMATRADRLSTEHVRALNSIDIEFVKNKPVTNAWKALFDHLNSQQVDPQAWMMRSEDLFIDLVFEMSRTMKFDFDKTHLRRAIYSPRAHGDAEVDALVIRKALVAIAKGEQGLRVDLSEISANQVEAAAADQAKQAVRDLLTGRRPLRVTIEGFEQPAGQPPGDPDTGRP